MTWEGEKGLLRVGNKNELYRCQKVKSPNEMKLTDDAKSKKGFINIQNKSKEKGLSAAW